MATTLQAPPQALSILLLIASMLLVRSAEPPPSIYRFDLIHVDADGNFTWEELIHHATNRTFLRAATLSTTDSTDSSTTVINADYRNHEYLMKLQIGTPPKPFLAVADTGSDFTWTKQLELCSAKASESFTNMTCSHSGDCGCNSCSNELVCMFQKTYGSKKKTVRGFIGTDMLTLSQEKKHAIRIPFGCASDCGDDKDDRDCRRLLPRTADGIFGLSPSPNSLLAELKVSELSYCLSSPDAEPEPRSQLWFGNGLTLPAGDDGTVQTTPLVQFKSIKPPIEKTSVWAYKYYVELLGISIGEYRKDLGGEAFQRTSNNDKGIMFVDSGCPFSHLEPPAFGGLKELLTKNGLTNKPSNNENYTCFAGAKRPEMVLHFTGADMTLPWDSYMFEYDKLFCLAIKEDERISVLGNFQQRNIHMLYYLELDKLSFVRVKDCGRIKH